MEPKKYQCVFWRMWWRTPQWSSSSDNVIGSLGSTKSQPNFALDSRGGSWINIDPEGPTGPTTVYYNILYICIKYQNTYQLIWEVHMEFNSTQLIVGVILLGGLPDLKASTCGTADSCLVTTIITLSQPYGPTHGHTQLMEEIRLTRWYGKHQRSPYLHVWWHVHLFISIGAGFLPLSVWPMAHRHHRG